MSADTACRTEPDLENNGELADMVAAMNVAANRMTPPNGFRSGASWSTNGQRSQLHGRKMSLQERGSRLPRQPTIETKRVSITDIDVRRKLTPSDMNQLLVQRHELFFFLLPRTVSS